MYQTLQQKQTGIKFGDILFSEPVALPQTTSVLDHMVPQPGLYVILTPDARYTPRPFRLIYIGESDNVNARANAAHEKFSAWKRQAGTAQLYRALCLLSGTTKLQRQAAETVLIRAYAPPCNDILSFNPFGLVQETRNR